MGEGGGQVGSQSRLSDDDISMLSDNVSRKSSTFGLSQRRNSSFADLFDSEDFGQSLLSRRHFTWSHDEREGRSGKKSKEENFSVNDPGIFENSCNQKTKEASSTKKKLSKILPTNWFFSNSDLAPKSRARSRNRTVSEGTESTEEEEEARKVSLSKLIISRHFTASTDVLDLNLVAPQSQ